MRRTDKEITDRATIESILAEAQVCRLAMARDNEPYIVPLNFVHHDNCLFIHSAIEGTKLDILRENPRVSFEVDIRAEVAAADAACNWSMKYFSVVGFGRVSFVKEPEEKRAVLQLIMQKYSGRRDWEFPDGMVNILTVMRVDISRMTGKKSKYTAWWPAEDAARESET